MEVARLGSGDGILLVGGIGKGDSSILGKNLLDQLISEKMRKLLDTIKASKSTSIQAS